MTRRRSLPSLSSFAALRPARQPAKTAGKKGPAKTGTPKTGTRKPRRRAAKSTASTRLAQALANPALWGAALALFGLFTLLALLSKSGALTGWWIAQLSLVFGVGVWLAAFAMMLSGVLLFMRAGGHAAWVTPTRVLGAFLLWMVLQAALHGLGSVTDAVPGQTLAGDYGGWTGWVLSQGLLAMGGPVLAVMMLLALALIGIMLAAGMGVGELAAGAEKAATGIIHGLVTVGRRLTQRRQDATRGPRLSLRQHWQAWRAARRQRAQASALEETEGPITTLPPDPAMPPTPAAEPLPPTMRIIGGEQTSWRLPQIDHILEDVLAIETPEEDPAERARVIEETLGSFGVPVTVIEVNKGPVVTQFGLRPEYVMRKIRGEEKRMKVRVSKIQALSNDLSLALSAAPIRIEAPVPGRNIVGLEVPNHNIAMVSLRSILESEEFQHLKGPLRIALGQDVSGRAVAASLARMPHLLVAGATGSGKSVCVNAIICSLLFQYTPDQLRFVMVDPKRVELTGYNGIPHLIDAVVTDIDKVVGVLHWATTEMDRRYKDLERAGARNIEVFNARRAAEGKPGMAYIVIFIDELADIMMMSPDEVERSLVRLAQMARATGIHLVISTQRPSVNVVTGLIKANFPSRVAFAVTSQIDSRVILDTPGAERLLGRGDMLFMRPDSAKLARLQGAFVSDAEVIRLVRYWHGLGSAAGGVRPLSDAGMGAILAGDEPPFEVTPTSPATQQRPLWDDMLAQAAEDSGRDPLFQEAVAIVRETGRASSSLLQRRLRIGYTRAARLIDMMEEASIVGPDQGGARGREVLEPANDAEGT